MTIQVLTQEIQELLDLFCWLSHHDDNDMSKYNSNPIQRYFYGLSILLT